VFNFKERVAEPRQLHQVIKAALLWACDEKVTGQQWKCQSITSCERNQKA